MPDAFERLIKVAYKKWKSELREDHGHPDEETMACFWENRLSKEESRRLKLHLTGCDACAEAFSIRCGLEPVQEREVPQDLLDFARALAVRKEGLSIFEISARLKEKMLQLLNTTGDVLVGQELVPAPVLRSRQIKDFKDEVVILKDFKDVRVEAKIENNSGKTFGLTVLVKKKANLEVIRDLRITLIRDELELESYHVDSGKAIFEHVACGKYTVEISSPESRLASILLDIKT